MAKTSAVKIFLKNEVAKDLARCHYNSVISQNIFKIATDFQIL